MLDLALVRAEPARVKAALARRGVPAERVDAAVDIDRRWSARREVREALRARRRQISEEVARRKTEGGPGASADAPDLLRAGRHAARDLKAVEGAMGDLAARREAAMLALPNLPAADVPETPPALDSRGPAWSQPFPPLAHWDLVAMLRLAEPAGASAGSGFLLWRGAGARLVRGLVRFMLDVHTEEGGREEVLAPPLATRLALTGSAHLPTLEGKMYRVVGPSRDPSRGPSRDREVAGTFASGADAGARSYPAAHAAGSQGAPRDADLFLAPRAEPHLAALYAGEVLDAAALPVRLVAAATALRRASHGGGAAGRGLLRLRAFPTVEVYTLCRPEASDAELERALADAETILERLDLAHRRRVRATTELSHAAARTVSLDVWCPGLPTAGEDEPGEASSADEDPGWASQPGHTPRASKGERGRWVEAAALSSFTDYQARRTGTRFRGADGATLRSGASLRSTSRTRLVHTVGGAAVAVPRLLAALLETGQQADGSVRLPAALEPYVGTGRLGAA